MENVNQLQESYLRLRETQRAKLFKTYFIYWIIITISTLIYCLTLGVTIGLSDFSDCGMSMSTLSVIDCWVSIILPIYLGILLVFGKKNYKVMKFYEMHAMYLMLVFAAWSLLCIFGFMISVDAWMKDDELTAYASTLVGIKGLLVASIVAMIMLVKLIYRILRPNIFETVTQKEWSRRKEEVQRSLVQLLRLKANELNFENDKDECWICMQALKTDQDVIVLPCHDKHCMHNAWISEWYVESQTCPMCKSTISSKMIQEKLKENDNFRTPISSDKEFVSRKTVPNISTIESP